MKETVFKLTAAKSYIHS